MSLIRINKEIDPTLEKELLRTNSRLRSDFLWILANDKNLRKRYANKYIAVRNKSVNFVGDTIEEMIITINSAHKQIDNFVIQYVTEEPISFLF